MVIVASKKSRHGILKRGERVVDQEVNLPGFNPLYILNLFSPSFFVKSEFEVPAKRKILDLICKVKFE